MTRLATLALILLTGWGPSPPPAQPAQPPTYTYQVLPQPHQHVMPQTPMGPAQGSIERCLQIQARGGLSC